MFRKTDTSQQLSLFCSTESQLRDRASKKYSDPKAWHNVFFRMVTSQIDEEVFRPLFPEGGKQGRPNASIRVLVAMSVLKEGFGCSDEQLMEKCEFDLLARKALGLLNLDDAMPSIDTYYLFRRRLVAHEERTGEDLLARSFSQVTSEQVRKLNISGKVVRMDSKLIGSNIALYSRYELIHKTLVKELKQYGYGFLSPEDAAAAKSYVEEDSGKTVYRSDKDMLVNRMFEIGNFIYRMTTGYEAHTSLFVLTRRVFGDQYEVVGGKPVLREGKKVSASSLQNPNDPDAAFRNKNGKKTSGYVTNLTETLPEKDDDGKTVKPGLVTSVQVEPATYGDCHFLSGAVENSAAVTGDTASEIFADGAYQSPENRSFTESHGIDLKTGKMQGGCRFTLNREEGTDDLYVTDKKTGETVKATYRGLSKSGVKRWRIPLQDVRQSCQWRYFTEEDVERSGLRQEIISRPPRELTGRNNVEAAMFQYSFHTRNGKTRYRGLLKHRMHAYARSMWMNLRRIVISCLLPCFCLIRGLFRPILRALGATFPQDSVFLGNPSCKYV